ncbi:MAG: hypothetical protein U0136_08650 [Bdellovibrionota bacterium]
MKAAFVTYGGGHVSSVAPVIRELQTKRGWDVRVLGLTNAGRLLSTLGIPFIGFRELVTAEDGRALELGEQLAETYHQESSGVPRSEAIAYLGLSFMDLMNRIGEDAARARLAEIGRRAFLPLGPLRRFLQSEPFDVVVATNSPRAEEAAIRAAGELSIPSLCMVDLFGIDWEPCVPAENGFADRVTVFSEFTKELLVARGRHADDVLVTGNPAFDTLAKWAPEESEALRREYGWGTKKVILWASQKIPEPELKAAMFDEFERLAADHPDWIVLYRPHPSEAGATLASSAALRLCPSEPPLGVLLRTVQAVVVVNSTLGVEAALCGSPVVQIMGSSISASAPYRELGIATEVHDLEHLSEAIAEVIDSRSPLSKQLASGRSKLPAAGGATSRVTDVIVSLAKKHMEQP